MQTDDLLISLEQMKGITDIDEDRCQSTVRGGTRLSDLGEKLAVFDQALINGDIDRQSLAGAIATGTHGTGLELPCLSALVHGFDLLTAQGEILQCNSGKNSEIFYAGHVAMGSLGI